MEPSSCGAIPSERRSSILRKGEKWDGSFHGQLFCPPRSETDSLHFQVFDYLVDLLV